MARRVIMRIDLTPAAQSSLDATVERFGMTKVTAMSRLVEWFHGLPKDVQYEIMMSSLKSSADAAESGAAALRASQTRLA